MKKFLLATVVLLGSISLANAERFSLGVTVSGGVFEADGASEIFSGDHSSNTTTTKVTKKASAEGENAEAAVAMGSIFFEINANEKFSLGVSYVPHSMDSETTENKQNIGSIHILNSKYASGNMNDRTDLETSIEEVVLWTY